MYHLLKPRGLDPLTAKLLQRRIRMTDSSQFMYFQCPLFRGFRRAAMRYHIAQEGWKIEWFWLNGDMTLQVDTTRIEATIMIPREGIYGCCKFVSFHALTTSDQTGWRNAAEFLLSRSGASVIDLWINQIPKTCHPFPWPKMFRSDKGISHEACWGVAESSFRTLNEKRGVLHKSITQRTPESCQRNTSETDEICIFSEKGNDGVLFKSRKRNGLKPFHQKGLNF